MKIPESGRTVAIRYEALGGVDLSTQSRFVSPSRSPRMRNMYKAYADGYADFLETRPGRRRLATFDGRIHRLYRLDGQLLIHAGGGLYTLDGVCRGALADAPSCGQVFDGRLWLIDGQDYYVFDGRTLARVEGFVPTTTVGRAPLGGGTAHQPVNLLTDRRINTFRADGRSSVYCLDLPSVSAVERVTVDGVEVTDYEVNPAAATVTFATPPAAAAGGDDNVSITFRAGISRRAAITGARTLCLFDNRLFAAGGETGLLRHCRLDDPTYFADTDWYREGEGQVQALSADGECLYAFTDRGLCRHTPVLDYELGRTYPTTHYDLPLGCVGFAAAFLDDTVWLSPRGLEGLADGFGHRSTLIDTELCLRRPLAMTVWNSYLCLLTEDRLYLADGRAPYRIDGRREYEWFVWEVALDGLFCDGESLYWYADGVLGVFEGESDEGTPIESCFETRAECGGDPALRKRVGRAGAVALLKRITNSDVTVTAVVDGQERALATYHMGGMNFAALDFATLSFTTDGEDLVKLPLSVKDYLSLTLRFASSRRFGVGAVSYRVGIIGYGK